MFEISNNQGEIERALDGLQRILDLRADKLGRRAMEMIARRIQARSQAELDPTGDRWPENEPRYKARKGNQPIGELTGRMLSIEEIEGTITVVPDAARMEFGLSEDSRQIAEWFEEGIEANNQPPRPFFELSAADEDALEAFIDEELDRLLDGLAGD